MTNGLRGADILEWLLGDWRATGPTVCVLEGFSGIGKSVIARKVRRAWSGPAVLVSAAESDDLETLLLLMAAKLEADGVSVVADHPDGDFRAGLLDLLANDALVIIDDFEAALDPESRLPRSPGLAELVRELSTKTTPGRVLLITSESPADGSWLNNVAHKTMFPPTERDARSILTNLMTDRGVVDEVAPEMLGDVVAWLGNNPRAMEAFVACLVDEPLEELIDLGLDAWQTRDLAASPRVIRRLEERFLTKTIARLDSPSRLLLESLSVFRRGFTIDALREMTPGGSSSEALKTGLASRFLIARNGKIYSINPVAKQLALASLERHQRRRYTAHHQAAQHYRKKLRPRPAGGIGGGGTPRDLVRVGREYVEARYHLLAVGADADFQDLAANYRRIILGNYSNLSRPPTDPGTVRELIATLGAALFDLPDGYGRLRAVLAALLVARGRPRDLEMAYAQATLATREERHLEPWLIRVELAGQLDTSIAVAAAVDQATRVLADKDLGILVRKAAEGHGHRRELPEAIKIIDTGLDFLRDPEARRHLLSLKAYVMTAGGRRTAAIDLLIDAYAEVGETSRQGWRLFEQALFLAHQQRDSARVGRIRRLIVDQGINDNQPILCDVIDEQIDGNYESAALKAAERTDYFTLLCQGAFAALSAGKVERASFLFESGRFIPNPAAWWLRGLIALCQESPDVYCNSMSEALGRDLEAHEQADPLLWLKVWSQRPPWIGIYPAFYFPRLPAALTGLSEDILFTDSYVPLETVYPLEQISLPVLRSEADSQSVQPSASLPLSTDRLPSITIIKEMSMGDSYHMRDGVVLGGRARVDGPVTGRDAFWLGGATGPEFVEQLRSMVDACEEDSSGAPAEEIASLRLALKAAEQGDAGGTNNALSKVGEWSLKFASAVGANAVAAAILSAAGIG